MAIQLLSSDVEAQAHGVKVLVYAKAGLGKTLMSATAPSPILISAESGLLCLRKENIAKVYGAKRKDINYDLPVIKIKTIDDLIEAYEWAEKSKEAQNFQTVCIDSLSEIAEVVLENAKKGLKDPRQAYMVLQTQISDVIRKFRDLSGKHIYMTAKQERIKDETSGVTLYGPSLPGAKLGQASPYFYDEVFQLGINKDTDGTSYRYLRTQPDLQYDAKDRSGSLEEIEEPHLGKIFNKIMSGV